MDDDGFCFSGKSGPRGKNAGQHFPVPAVVRERHLEVGGHDGRRGHENGRKNRDLGSKLELRRRRRCRSSCRLGDLCHW